MNIDSTHSNFPARAIDQIDRMCRFAKTASAAFHVSWLVFVAALIWRIILLDATTGVYSWDVFFRAFHGNRFFVSHWLPLLQSFIVVGYATGTGIAIAQTIAMVNSSLAAAFIAYFVARRQNAPLTGLATGLALGLLPTLAFISIMPYQEPIVLPFLIWIALRITTPEQSIRTGIGLYFAATLACIGRYEAWILLLIAISWLYSKKHKKAALLLTVCLLIGMFSALPRLFVSPPEDPAHTNLALIHPWSSDGATRLSTIGINIFVAIKDTLTLPMAICSIIAIWGLRRQLKYYWLLGLASFMALFAMGFARGYINGSINPRMILFALVILLPLAVIGLRWCLNQLPLRYPVRTILFCVLMSPFLLLYARDGLRKVHEASLPFHHDAALSREIERLPSSGPFVIRPQWYPFEHGSGSIMSNSPIIRRHREYLQKGASSQMLSPPQYLLFWTRQGYMVCSLDKEKNVSKNYKALAQHFFDAWKTAPAQSHCYPLQKPPRDDPN